MRINSDETNGSTIRSIKLIRVLRLIRLLKLARLLKLKKLRVGIEPHVGPYLQ